MAQIRKSDMPQREPDLVLPSCNGGEIAKLAIWVEEEVFLKYNQYTDGEIEPYAFGPTISSEDLGKIEMSPIEYLLAEIDSNRSQARADIALTYFAQKEILDSEE